tara:strand:+ start:145 stop:477 length:333 start_codon:yes stop_codon:yes gene_type:complete
MRKRTKKTLETALDYWSDYFNDCDCEESRASYEVELNAIKRALVDGKLNKSVEVVLNQFGGWDEYGDDAAWRRAVNSDLADVGLLSLWVALDFGTSKKFTYKGTVYEPSF